MSVKKVAFDSIVADKKKNHRGIDANLVDDLFHSIHKSGLFESPKCQSTVKLLDDGESVQVFKLVDGFHRYEAIKRLRKKDPDAYARWFPNDKIEVRTVDGDDDQLHDVGVVSNTHRKMLEPWEIYAEIVRRERMGRDQYETAADLRIQQPRIAEYLSFQRCITEVHDQWKAGVLSHNDMIQFAAMEPEDQEKALKAFLAGVEATGGKKAEARKELKKKAKSGKREYENAGKPSRKTLSTYQQYAYVNASSADRAADRHFWNAIAAAFKVMSGEVDFAKLTPEKEWVNKKEAAAASEFVAVQEEKQERKAAREKAATKKKPSKKKSTKKSKKSSKQEGEG